MAQTSSIKLKQVNNLLLLLIVLINGYIFLAPLWPAVVFHFESHGHKQQQLQATINKPATTFKVPPGPNRLVVPSMLLDQPILQGTVANQFKTLDQGIWLWPRGSTPDKGGNTTLIGHRYTYTNPRGVFYFLNKVSVKDQIAVYWNNKEYVYQVVSVSQVAPNDTAIEANTSQAELTLFTCTPLWLPKDRLVVVADLEKTYD